MKNTITIDFLHKLFEYKDGFLYRKIARGKFHAGDVAGRLHPNGYRYVNINKKNYCEHRVIFAMHNNYWPETVDHIDRNKANNNIENLRHATHTENSYNRPIRVDNVSGCSGITWNKQYKKWIVRITENGKRHFLGKYDNLEFAKNILNSAKINFHKEFANV